MGEDKADKGMPFNETAFDCPLCGAYAMQTWEVAYSQSLRTSHVRTSREVSFAICAHCRGFSIWYQKRMIYPSTGNAPLPHELLPNEIKDDYNEARSIVSLSPRSAAAILRLCIEKLTHDVLTKDYGSLNNNIRELVKKGCLPAYRRLWI